MNNYDNYLQHLVPTVMVPQYEQLQFLSENGHRILMASNGVFLEVKRNWVHLIHKISHLGKLSLPYGNMNEKMELAFGFPITLVKQFVYDAQASFPNECGAWLIHNRVTGEFRYERLTALKATCDYLEVIRPLLEEDESLVIDLHSHGACPAFFSTTDDKDDFGEFKIAGVIGCLGGDQKPTALFRLCAAGITIQLKTNNAKIFDIN